MNCRLISTSVIAIAVLCGCSHVEHGPTANGKVLLGTSLREKERLLARLGFSNILFAFGPQRDSKGARLFIEVKSGPGFDQATQQLVVVTADGIRIKPWRDSMKVTDDEEARSVRSLPQGVRFLALDGNWIALEAKGQRPWLAKLDTPMVVAAELPDSHNYVHIYSSDQVVHVFARRSWRNAEGPMKYLVFDFSRSGSQPIKAMTLRWGRASLDMDPDNGIAVLNDNNSFWGKTWLVDLKTDKRKLLHLLAFPDSELFVKKEVAQKWIELTKP